MLTIGKTINVLFVFLQVINADKSIEEVHSQIYGIAKQVMEESKHKNLETLWEN